MRYDDVGRAQIERRVREGTLRRVRRGVYLPPATGDSVATRRTDEHRAQVVALTARLGTDHWISHESAAVVWGCWTYRLGGRVHVTQLGNPSVRAADTSVRRHWTSLPPRDRSRVDGVPVTSLERTVVDCARVLPMPGALVVADSALRLGARPALLATLVDEAVGRRGVRQARRVVELADGTSESPGETLVRWVALDAGLPPLVGQVAVHTWQGAFRLDAGWPDVRVGIEFDGKVKYGGGLYGDPQERLLAEKARHDAIVEAGWTLLRVTWADLADPESLASRLRSARSRAFGRPRRPTGGAAAAR
ncbi:hypothetical protein Slu03_24980 [Sediminihabitans luteus]|nr:hypothetical protein Slu03_24980 [Sediminihabitans luteus]